MEGIMLVRLAGRYKAGTFWKQDLEILTFDIPVERT